MSLEPSSAASTKEIFTSKNINWNKFLDLFSNNSLNKIFKVLQ